jgi:transposase
MDGRSAPTLAYHAATPAAGPSSRSAPVMMNPRSSLRTVSGSQSVCGVAPIMMKSAAAVELGQVDRGLPGPVEVLVGIETDRGPWVQALVASGYLVYPINPLQVARFRETERSSGGKSDAADAHTLTDMVRTKRYTLKRHTRLSPACTRSQRSPRPGTGSR